MTFIFIALGVCLMLAAVGGVVGFWIWLDGRDKNTPSVDDTFRQAVETRLDEIERRLTDTQDVMLVLSEKVDHWEADRRSVDHPTT